MATAIGWKQQTINLTGKDTPMSMNAVVMQHGSLDVRKIPIPRPGPGEVLVKTLACGICGSDLHCLAHGQKLIDSARAVTGVELFSVDRPVVLGHEICGEIVEHGPGTRKASKTGTRVVSPPFVLRPQIVTLGFGDLDTPGGFGEYVVLTEDLTIPVPDHIPSDIASMNEPMTVALHALNRGNLGGDEVPIVIGCGPIGLAMIAVLKMRGIGPIVAADFSPSRRRMAERLGADIVVDPRETSPYDSWSAMAATDMSHAGRQTAMFPEFAFRQAVIFECVGVPGIIQQVLASAPPCSKVVVAGLCMEPDTFNPSFAIMKEIDLIFSMVFTPQEFAESFEALVAGKFDISPLITGRVGLDGVSDAFTRLGDPERDAKIIITP